MNAEGLFSLFAPLIALFLVRKLLRMFGMGDLLKAGTAAFLPMAGALKMSGQDNSSVGKGLKESWFGRKGENGQGDKKGIADRLGLKRADAAAAKIAKANKYGTVVAGAKGAQLLGKKMAPEGGAIDQRLGIYDRKAALVGRKDADGNLIESGMLQRLTSLRSMQVAARNTSVLGIRLLPAGGKVDRGLNKLTTGKAEMSPEEREKLTGRKGRIVSQAERDEIMRQSRRERIRNRKLFGATLVDDEGNTEKMSAGERRALGGALHIANIESLDRQMHLTDPKTGLPNMGETVARSHAQIEAAKQAYAAAHGYKTDSVVASHLGHAALPAAWSLRALEQGSDEARMAMASHPAFYFPEQIRARRDGDDDATWSRRMMAYGDATGVYDPDSGRWADMLALNGINVNRPGDAAMVLQAIEQAKSSGTLQSGALGALAITVPASVAAEIEASLRILNSETASSTRTEIIETKNTILNKEITQSEQLISDTPIVLSGAFDAAQRSASAIADQIQASLNNPQAREWMLERGAALNPNTGILVIPEGGLRDPRTGAQVSPLEAPGAPSAESALRTVSEVNESLKHAVETMTRAVEEAGALRGFAEISVLELRSASGASKGDEVAGVADVIERIAEENEKLVAETRRNTETADRLVGALQSAIRSGDQASINTAQNNIANFRAEMEQRAQIEAAVTQSKLEQMRAAEQAQRLEDERMRQRYTSAAPLRSRLEAIGRGVTPLP